MAARVRGHSASMAESGEQRHLVRGGLGFQASEPPRFLCDAMLHRLGRFLRAAGYDTALAGRGQPDGDLLARAHSESRVFVTRDRRLKPPAGATMEIVCLFAKSLDDSALELRARLGIDWLHAPFTRCLVDNALLRKAVADELDRLPPKARALGGPVTACPACSRIYWPGSHVRRMTARLDAWQQGRPYSEMAPIR